MAGNDPRQPVTREMLDQAVDNILEGVSRLLVAFADQLQGRFENQETRIKTLEEDLSSIKTETRILKSSLSDLPSRQEFNRLKARVDKSTPVP